jgi:putative thiamine transport system permease protein
MPPGCESQPSTPVPDGWRRHRAGRPASLNTPSVPRFSRPRTALALGLALLVSVPLGWAAMAAVAAGLDADAWRALAADPQWPRALRSTLFTGVAATALSVALTAWLLSRSFPGPAWDRLLRALPPMLATPHAAFAIGLAFLLAPSGWILRALSPWATGLQAPPDWSTTQDPWGLGLVLALVCKEVPFLLWAAAGQLQRADSGPRWARELAVARTMGYGATAAWWRIVWPQLWPRLAAPVLAVGAYSLTVVDVALVIGPAAPPTAAVLAWQWLLDADPAANAQGAVAAWALAALAAGVGGLFLLLRRPLLLRASWSTGIRGRRDPLPERSLPAAWTLRAVYGAVLAALAVGSFSGVWPFPQLLPQTWSLGGWRSVLDSAGTVGLTLALAIGSSLAALAWAVLWLEAAPTAWDRRLRRLLYLPLLLPSILWVVGLHRVALAWRIDAHWLGLWLAHALAALPYVLITLSPAYWASMRAMATWPRRSGTARCPSCCASSGRCCGPGCCPRSPWALPSAWPSTCPHCSSARGASPP